MIKVAVITDASAYLSDVADASVITATFIDRKSVV